MKQRIRLTESDLHRIVKESVNRILTEANKSGKLKNSFKSKEDMTKYRDMYSPSTHTSIYDTDNTFYDSEDSGEGAWGSGPYMPYKETRFGDGYDYCGDDDYNDYASDYNQALRKKLTTKGGQMSDDWESQLPNKRALEHQKELANDYYAYRQKLRRDAEERRNRQGKTARRRWINGASLSDMEELGDIHRDMQDYYDEKTKHKF